MSVVSLNEKELPDPQLDENAVSVLEARYLKCDEDGNPVEEPKDLFVRVAEAIARPEITKYNNSKNVAHKLARRFYLMMAQGRWMPNSPTLFNAGRDLGCLSACFVLPVKDDMESIMETAKNSALIHKAGGGTGYSFSRLRPRGDRVQTTSGTATGPVSFMDMYDGITEKIKQGGQRRGANMGILRCDHPDIREFINAKRDTDKITNFNISVAATDEFMRAVQDREAYDLVNPRTQEVVGQENAREILELIAENARETSEPGLFFIDEANYWNPVPHLGDYEATNPCGEQALLPYDVCNLGHINLAEFVENGEVDWSGIENQVRLGMRFLDNVIDANDFPLPEIRSLADRIRRVGHGVMGFADMLTALGIPYDSPEALDLADEVAEFVWQCCLDASEELAHERGVFPEWEMSIWGPDEACARDETGNRIREYRPMRNCNTNTVAPTGTTSIIAGCSGGIEPLFAIAFKRNQAGMEMLDVNDQFEQDMRVAGYYDEDVMERVAESGSAQVDGVPDRIKRVYKTAHEIDPIAHVRMQAVWQKYTDNAISKTINLPSDVDVEGVRQAYMNAWETGCKGITVYRDGSRDGQALEAGTSGEDDESEDTTRDVEPDAGCEGCGGKPDTSGSGGTKTKTVTASSTKTKTVTASRQKRERPGITFGPTHRIDCPLGRLYVTINRPENSEKPIEVFVALGKAGGHAAAAAESLGRLISLALRYDVPMEQIYEELRGIASDPVGFGPDKVLSMADAIAQVLERHVEDDRVMEIGVKANGDTEGFAACPDCGSSLQMSEGCESCPHCGYSRCG